MKWPSPALSSKPYFKQLKQKNETDKKKYYNPIKERHPPPTPHPHTFQR